jgi:hypothetical protein
MAVGDALRELAKTVDRLDETGVEVVRAVPEETGGGEVVADLRVRIPLEKEPGAITAADSAPSGESQTDAASSVTDDAGIGRSPAQLTDET